MSVKVMSAVWDQSQSTGNDRLVLLKIADEADDSGANAYPGYERLSATTRVPKRTVIRCVERLEALGELEVIRPEVQGRGRFNTYRVILPGIGGEVTPIPNPPKKAPERRVKARKGDAPSLPTCDDAEYPEPINPEPIEKETTDAPPSSKEVANRIARDDWERRKVKPVGGNFVAFRARLQEQLDAGRTEDELRRVLPRMSMFSRNAFDFAWSQGSPRAVANRDNADGWDRNGQSGVIDL